jgi:dTMP kinase
MQKSGKFIVIEGMDGCGKSTHAKLLSTWLKSQGHDVVLTGEPSHGKIGRLLRVYLKEETLPIVDALLFIADRAEHLEKTVKPALDAGKVVICERYYYSTLAYQAAQGIDRGWLMELNAFALEPDLVTLLDLTPEQAYQRTSTEEKFENVAFLKKVRQQYLQIAQGKKNFVKIKAMLKKHEVQTEIQKAVSKIL